MVSKAGSGLRARRVMRMVALSAALPATLLSSAPQAHAFKLFGLTLFEANRDTAPVIDPVRYHVTITAPGSDASLVRKLRSASNLVADQSKPVSGAAGLLAKARGDRETLVATLYEQARYDAVVDIAIDGRPLDTIPPDATFPSAAPVPVAITVHPGQPYRLGNVVLAGGAAGYDPAAYDLAPGGPAGSANVLKAESDIVLSLKKKGHPFARVADRQIVADHATHRLDVRLDFATGPKAAFGDLRVTGTKAVDKPFVAYMADIGRGKLYTPETVSDARDRLLALGVFDSVRVKPAETLSADGSLPVDIDVTDRKPHFLGIGATLSNIDGAGIEGYWGNRNLFGRAERLRLDASIAGIGARSMSRLDYNAKLAFTKPGVLGPESKFTANLGASFDHPDAYDKFSVSGGAGLTYQFTRHQTVSGGVELEWARVDDAYGTSRHLLLSVPLEYAFDNRDNKLDPAKGFRIVVDGEPDHDFLSGASYLRLSGQISAYRALDPKNRFVIAGRLAAGTIVGASLPDIIADKRYYSGGGGSVRGYGFQAIGPKNADGTPTGGRAFAETSLELRFRATDKIGLVSFIDGGSVTHAEVPAFSGMRFGAGIGLRYMTGFGPLRLDAAVPLNRQPGDANFGLYAGIGQAF